jgi:Uma2 family endonuclease
VKALLPSVPIVDTRIVNITTRNIKGTHETKRRHYPGMQEIWIFDRSKREYTRECGVHRPKTLKSTNFR